MYAYINIIYYIGIRIDILDNSNKTHTALLTHNDLEKCVGDAIASFTNQLINNDIYHHIKPGIFFPEEVDMDTSSSRFRNEILNDIAQDAITYSYTD